MDRRRTRRLLTLAPGFMAVGALSALSAGPASAQIPNPIGEITEDVDTVVTEVGDGVAEIAEEATADVGGIVGGDLGQTTEDVGAAAGDIVRDTTKEAGNFVSDTGAALDEAVEGVVGGSEEPGAGTGGTDVSAGGSGGNGRISDRRSDNDLSVGRGSPALDTVLAPDTNPAPGFVSDAENVGSSDGSERTILDALEGITFPLALIAIAAAFLAIQGRIDRKDPKLTLALLDPDDEMLSFR
jgi:hypothetical protein